MKIGRFMPYLFFEIGESCEKVKKSIISWININCFLLCIYILLYI